MRPPSPPLEVSASGTLIGLLLATDKDGHDHVEHLCKIINKTSSDHTSFSKRFAKLNHHIELDRGLGHGGFGTVLSCKVSEERAALKFEVGNSNQPSCLEHEAIVYHLYSGNAMLNPECPFPQLIRAFHSKKHCFMTISLGGIEEVRILCIQHVDLEPQNILQRARTVFHEEYRIEASFRYIVLKLLYASLYLVQHGVIHLDFKVSHLAFRSLTSDLVFVDWGMAVIKDRKYKNKDDMRNVSKRAKCCDVSYGLTGLGPQAVLPRFALDRPGTRGSRPPRNLGCTFDGSCRAFIWQLAVVIFELFRAVPFGRDAAEQYEKQLYEAVERNGFDAFMVFALDGKKCPNDTVRHLLEFVHDLFQDSLSEKRPVDIITHGLMSEFALAYISEEIELEKILSHEGYVCDGFIHPNGRIQRPLVLVKVDGLGLMAFQLFDSLDGDPASPYAGRLVDAPSPNILSRANFCMHGLSLGNGKILDGQPRDDIPLRAIIRLKMIGSLFISSRIDPATSLHGNVGLPDRLNPNALKQVNVEGVVVHSIDMKYRRNSRFGQACSWDYKWGNGGGSVAMSRGKVVACMRPKGRIDWFLTNKKIRNIITKRRLEVLSQGKYSDADWGQCKCDNGLLVRHQCCRFLSSDLKSITPITPVQSPGRGMVWTSPEVAEPGVIGEMTVPANPFNAVRFSELIAGPGSCIVSGVKEMFPDKFAEGETFARQNASTLCTNSVFIYPANKNGSPNVGRGDKKLGYLPEDCATAQLLLLILALIRPGYKPLRATRNRGNPVPQLELILQLPPPSDRVGEVQVYHVDAAVSGLPGLEDEDSGLLRINLEAVIDDRGPLSLFVPFDDDYYVIVYLTGHILAIECMKHFCRHYNLANRTFFEENPGSSKEEFQAVWCGGTVQFIKELYPDVQLEPVRIPVRKGDVLAIPSYIPHCGPPIPGMRGFVLAGPEVFSDSQGVYWCLLSCTDLLTDLPKRLRVAGRIVQGREQYYRRNTL